MFTKCIVVVDEDVNVQDIGEVVLKVFNNIDPERDIQFTLRARWIRWTTPRACPISAPKIGD